jgi:S-layer domain protein
MYGEAKPVEKSITVTRHPAGVMVAQGSYRAGYPLDLIYSYKQLVNAEDALRMPDPVRRGSLLVKSSDGQTVDASRGLAAGAYKVEVGPAGAYQTDCYEVTPEAGAFTVEQADLWRIALRVTDGSHPLEGAVVNLDSEARISTARGLVEWFLPAGKTYTFTVGKAGFAYRTVVVDLKEGKPVEQEVVLAAASIQLKYSVAADIHGVQNGAIEVQPVQQLAPGSDGQPVMAVANEGYRFVKWDDNSTDNPRVDRNVMASQEVKAIFEPQQFTLEYGVEMAGNGAGGTVEGNVHQTVPFGTSGTEVEAKPAAGSFFGGWSDGVRTAKRSDGAKNLQVKAIFGNLATLPHANSFGDGSLGDGWYTISTGPDYNPWSVVSLAQSNVEALEGYFAACNSEKFGSEGHTQSSLYSPVFTGIGALTQDLHVAMTYAFEESLQDANADGKEFALQMSVDGKEWKNLLPFEAGVELNNTSVTIPKKRFKGAHTIQLRWRYDAKWGLAAEVDNVLVQVKDWDDDTGDEVRVTCKANPANAGTFVVDGTGDDAGELNVARGDVLPDGIRAVAAEGYEFTGWSTGSADSVLRIVHELFRDEEYTANFRELAKPLVTFRSQPAEGGVCKVAGNTVASLEVNRGDVIETTAVPQADYRFAYWVDNGSTQATRTVTVDASRTLIAAYEKVVLYEASFMVTDHAGKPLDGARVKVADQELTTVGGSAKTTATLQEGEYPFRVELDGYFPVEGVLKVGKFFRDAKVVMRKPVAVDFTVKDAEGAALAGASISVVGGPQDVDFTRQMETGVGGKASFMLPSGDYSYTVEMKGYLPVQEKLVVGDVSVPVEVTLHKPVPNRYTLTFTVTTRSRPLEGARVTIGEKVLFTDTEGVVSFLLEEGEYSYQVSKDGYESKEDRVKLEGDDAEVKVVLAKKKRPKPTPDAVEGNPLASVVVAPNPFSEALEVKGMPADCRIQVFDALGKVVYAKEASGGERTTLQLGHLPSGVYLLVLEQGAARRVLRLLKQ